jgi:fatty acid desaturase
MSNMKVSWYRTPLSKEQLSSLIKKSDAKGGTYIFLHFLLLALTGYSSFFFLNQQAWVMAAPFIALHGAFFSFLGWAGAGHELMHNTVFKTRGFNLFFYKLFAFLTWNNPNFFSVSHTYHHKYTVFKDLDQEVILPQKISIISWCWALTFNFPLFIRALKITTENSLGITRGTWSATLFPDIRAKQRKKVILWARFMLLTHILLATIFILNGLWPLIIIITLAPFIFNWINVTLASGQHFGMESNVSDFRLNSRTILLNPFLAFLYWQMNYHIEHHMYPNVPFHNLKRLHTVIHYDTPTPTQGVIGLLREMQMLNKN